VYRNQKYIKKPASIDAGYMTLG